MSKTEVNTQEILHITKNISNFLVEDFKFQRYFLSAINKLPDELKRKYESVYNFHKNKMDTLAETIQLKVKVFDGCDYNEGLPVTPLNADEFSVDDVLIVSQTIEPTIITYYGDVAYQGSALLTNKN